MAPPPAAISCGRHAAVKAYIAASDTYQACINDYVTAQKAQADKDKKPMDPAIIQAEGDKVTANQNNKQKVGDDYQRRDRRLQESPSRLTGLKRHYRISRAGIRTAGAAFSCPANRLSCGP